MCDAIDIVPMRSAHTIKCAQIEHYCFHNPLTAQQLDDHITGTIGRGLLPGTGCALVAIDEDTELVIGHLLYEIRGTCYHLLRVAVDPHYQRSGVGMALIHDLRANLTPYIRHITADVDADNMDQQLWLAALGFHAAPRRDSVRFILSRIVYAPGAEGAPIHVRIAE